MDAKTLDAQTLASHARAGRAREVLPDLLTLAGDPARVPEQAWPAAASAIELLFWQDRFDAAADLAERVIVALAGTGSRLERQDMPFDDALLAGELHAGAPAAPRLRRLIPLLPESSVLGRHLGALLDRLASTSDIERLIGGFRGWGDASREPDALTVALLNRRYAKLSDKERRLLWGGLVSANAIGTARQLYEHTGSAPPTFDAATWLAGWLAYQAEHATASRLLIDAHRSWWPYASWDILPITPVILPVLRSALTDDVRAYYLSSPTGPEAEQLGGS